MERQSFNIEFSIEVYQDGAYYMAGCPALDLITQGRNEKEARKRLEEVMQLFFDSCAEKGVLGITDHY